MRCFYFILPIKFGRMACQAVLTAARQYVSGVPNSSGISNHLVAASHCTADTSLHNHLNLPPQRLKQACGTVARRPTVRTARRRELPFTHTPFPRPRTTNTSEQTPQYMSSSVSALATQQYLQLGESVSTATCDKRRRRPTSRSDLPRRHKPCLEPVPC
jgi:hypothetical protein